MKQFTELNQALNRQTALLNLLGSLLHGSIQAKLGGETDVSFKLLIKARILQTYMSGQRIVDDEETILVNEILTQIA